MQQTLNDIPSSDLDTTGANIPASRVSGTDVYNGEGEHLGHIHDVVLNKQTGAASYAVMSFGGFLGIGERYHPLPWQSLTYDPGQGGYVVGVSRHQLEKAPTYGAEDRPDWNDREFHERVYDYYGYPPV